MGHFKRKDLVYDDDDPQPDLPYPTREVEKSFKVPGAEATSLPNFAFLATLSFSSTEEAWPLPDRWFGPGVAVDRFRVRGPIPEGNGNGANLPPTPSHTSCPRSRAIPPRRSSVSGGSEAVWDRMVDMQPWSSSIFAQLIVGVNPLGFIWDPIMHDVVSVINISQSRKLEEVSYHQLTTQFVEALYGGYRDRKYENLRVIGASLGGGLAILTGAITGAAAVSNFGLNAMYSRRTFPPPITKHQLDTRVFNAFRNATLLPKLTSPGMNYKRMLYNAPKHSLFGCIPGPLRDGVPLRKSADSNQLLVREQLRVGTYPKPTQIGSQMWEEACSKLSAPSF